MSHSRRVPLTKAAMLLSRVSITLKNSNLTFALRLLIKPSLNSVTAPLTFSREDGQKVAIIFHSNSRCHQIFHILHAGPFRAQALGFRAREFKRSDYPVVDKIKLALTINYSSHNAPWLCVTNKDTAWVRGGVPARMNFFKLTETRKELADNQTYRTFSFSASSTRLQSFL